MTRLVLLQPSMCMDKLATHAPVQQLKISQLVFRFGLNMWSLSREGQILKESNIMVRWNCDHNFVLHGLQAELGYRKFKRLEIDLRPLLLLAHQLFFELTLPI
ncbi:hypothetical protein F0562_016790 [Nyssa sinensis]|uniref:Uncharacterized protein n=1 Tax=Nyssa sinensis TaxID=561372 RepID=A0A5J4ZFT9_9ASTE|nr:hypothetical protein F0562_016790 [Nyssa sinensis]